MKIEVSMLRTVACHQHDEAGAGLGTATAGCWSKKQRHSPIHRCWTQVLDSP